MSRSDGPDAENEHNLSFDFLIFFNDPNANQPTASPRCPLASSSSQHSQACHASGPHIKLKCLLTRVMCSVSMCCPRVHPAHPACTAVSLACLPAHATASLPLTYRSRCAWLTTAAAHITCPVSPLSCTKTFISLHAVITVMRKVSVNPVEPSNHAKAELAANYKVRRFVRAYPLTLADMLYFYQPDDDPKL